MKKKYRAVAAVLALSLACSGGIRPVPVAQAKGAEKTVKVITAVDFDGDYTQKGAYKFTYNKDGLVKKIQQTHDSYTISYDDEYFIKESEASVDAQAGRAHFTTKAKKEDDRIIRARRTDGSYMINLSYDEKGRVKKTVSGGYPTTYTYDKAGRMKTADDNILPEKYEYNKAGNICRYQNPYADAHFYYQMGKKGYVLKKTETYASDKKNSVYTYHYKTIKLDPDDESYDEVMAQQWAIMNKNANFAFTPAGFMPGTL